MTLKNVIETLTEQEIIQLDNKLIKILIKEAKTEDNGAQTIEQLIGIYKKYATCEEDSIMQYQESLKANSLDRLGDFYFQGIGREQDYEQAAKYYKLADAEWSKTYGYDDGDSKYWAMVTLGLTKHQEG